MSEPKPASPVKPANSDGSVNPANQRTIASQARESADWFARHTTAALGENLLNLTIYGPVVTPIFCRTEHHLHYLIVVSENNVDQLMELAKSSAAAAKQRISAPLIMTGSALQRSYDVFPLEWIDISQFHLTVVGQPLLDSLQVDPTLVRLQCERELRSLEIQLQRGILASGGGARLIRQLEELATDILVRVLRGICWLAQVRQPLLPDELLERCEHIVQQPLPGCQDAIDKRGRHDLTSIRWLLDEFAILSRWVDQFEKVGT